MLLCPSDCMLPTTARLRSSFPCLPCVARCNKACPHVLPNMAQPNERRLSRGKSWLSQVMGRMSLDWWAQMDSWWAWRRVSR